MSVAGKNNKITKRTSKRSSSKIGSITVSDKVGNYEKHPFFIKKANEVKEFLKKAGLPEFTPRTK